MSVKQFLEYFHKNPYLLWILVAVNLAGTCFGVYYYWHQLVTVPLYLLPVVPDSPTATFLFTFALILLFFKKESKLLNNFAFFGLVKVGLWTLFTMIVYDHFFFSPENVLYFGTLFVLHGGMVIEAFVIRNRLGFALKQWLPIALFYLLGDFADYYLATVPTPLPLDRPDLLPLLAIESILVTLALVWFFARKK